MLDLCGNILNVLYLIYHFLLLNLYSKWKEQSGFNNNKKRMEQNNEDKKNQNIKLNEN